jgi:hypothetical protein
MAIIKQYDKRSGITYVYESKSFWDKEKKTSRAKRTLIGRFDPESGEIVPTDGRGRKEKTKAEVIDTPDYTVLYEKLLNKCAAHETLIAALKKQLNELKEGK